jgi:hypothetical protein
MIFNLDKNFVKVQIYNFYIKKIIISNELTKINQISHFLQLPTTKNTRKSNRTNFWGIGLNIIHFCDLFYT